MKKTLTHSEMLGIWRMFRHLEPPLAEASVERYDCLEVDRMLSIAMRAWYLDLLDNAPLRMVCPVDIAPRLSWTRVEGSTLLVADIPADVRRIVAVTSGGLPLELSSGSVTSLAGGPLPRRRASCSPLGCQPAMYSAAPAIPAASVTDTAICVDSPKAPDSVMAVTDPGDETYIFDEAALSTIPLFEFSNHQPLLL